MWSIGMLVESCWSVIKRMVTHVGSWQPMLLHWCFAQNEVSWGERCWRRKNCIVGPCSTLGSWIGNYLRKHLWEFRLLLTIENLAHWNWRTWQSHLDIQDNTCGQWLHFSTCHIHGWPLLCLYPHSQPNLQAPTQVPKTTEWTSYFRKGKNQTESSILGPWNIIVKWFQENKRPTSMAFLSHPGWNCYTESSPQGRIFWRSGQRMKNGNMQENCSGKTEDK